MLSTKSGDVLEAGEPGQWVEKGKGWGKRRGGRCLWRRVVVGRWVPPKKISQFCASLTNPNNMSLITTHNTIPPFLQPSAMMIRQRWPRQPAKAIFNKFDFLTKAKRGRQNRGLFCAMIIWIWVCLPHEQLPSVFQERTTPVNRPAGVFRVISERPVIESGTYLIPPFLTYLSSTDC